MPQLAKMLTLFVVVLLASLVEAKFWGLSSSSSPSGAMTPVKNGYDLVNTFDDMPACNTIATAQLIQSCDALRAATDNSFESLSTIYATRLAVCELFDAGVEVPAACKSFIPATDMLQRVKGKGLIKDGLLTTIVFTYPDYDRATADATSACTAALHEHPQSWVSFSNNKQNAAAICRDKKTELQKDEIVHAAEYLRQAASQGADNIDLLMNKLKLASEHFSKYNSTVQSSLESVIEQLRDFQTAQSQAAAKSTQDLVAFRSESEQMLEAVGRGLNQTQQMMGNMDLMVFQLIMIKGDLADAEATAEVVRKHFDLVHTEIEAKMNRTLSVAGDTLDIVTNARNEAEHLADSILVVTEFVNAVPRYLRSCLGTTWIVMKVSMPIAVAVFLAVATRRLFRADKKRRLVVRRKFIRAVRSKTPFLSKSEEDENDRLSITDDSTTSPGAPQDDEARNSSPVPTEVSAAMEDLDPSEEAMQSIET